METISAHQSVKEQYNILKKDMMTNTFDRFNAQGKRCSFCEQGISCQLCSNGPCRIKPGAERGVCGIDADAMAMRNMMNTITLITIRNTPQTISLMMYQRILTIQRKQRNRNANTASPMDCAVCLMFIAAVILGVVCQVLQFCQFFRTISYGVPSCP